MKEYEALIRTITRFLVEDSHNEARIIERLNHMQRKKGNKLYQALLYVLTHLEFPENMAKKHWEGIMAHREQMSNTLAREVGLRVAMCDYFFNINKELENPIIIEIEVFEQAQKRSNIDVLTGLFNRRYFESALESEISRANRLKKDVSLLFVDIDNFKKYNDTHGHLAGDDALKTVAKTTLKHKRMIDIACRYGGEEFVLILPNTPKSGAMVVGERIRKKVAGLKSGRGSGKELKESISFSGGIATFPQDANTSKDLVSSADQALYAAKMSGKNRISLFANEKRRFIRAPIHVPVFYKVIDMPDEFTHEGRSLDVSEGGVLCEVYEAIPISSTMSIDMKLPDSERVHSFIGDVVRANGGNPASHHVGVSFLRVQSYARQAISDYIRQALCLEGKG